MMDIRKGYHELEGRRLVNCPVHKKGRRCLWLYGKRLFCSKTSCHLFVAAIQRYDSKGEYRDDSEKKDVLE